MPLPLKISLTPDFPWLQLLSSLGLRGCLAIMAGVGGGACVPGWAGAPDTLELADFEGARFGGWTTGGSAFGTGPARGVPDLDGLTDYEGDGVALSSARGLAETGILESAPFVIERPYLNFQIAGERNHPAVVGVELRVGGRVVRSASATESKDIALHARDENAMMWRTWDVREWSGESARIRVIDHSATGAIAVDTFVLSPNARVHPTDSSGRLHETYRPQFHFTAEAGWLNDPNGLLYYDGTWHLFFQSSEPGSPVLVWGHATSTDLLHWNHHPPAVLSDGVNSAYSGSGLVDWANASGLQLGAHPPLLLFYSIRPPGPKLVTGPEDGGESRMTQGMTYSVDGGATWTPFPANPILTTPDFRDRDPKVIYHEPSRAWFQLLSLSRNNHDRDNASYGVFKSSNLRDWELIQEVGHDRWFWECPDLFELPVDDDAADTRWLLLNGAGNYLVGRFDATGFHQEAGPFTMRWGGNSYASQTFNDAPNGRRVQISWMSTKRDAPVSYPGMPFNQQMTFPRDLTLRGTPTGPRLFRYPVPEIERLYQSVREIPAGPLAVGVNLLVGVTDELLDLEFELQVAAQSMVELNLRGHRFQIDVARSKLISIDDDPESMAGAAGEAPVSIVDGRLHLRVLLDRASIEVFTNHGESDLSVVFYPDPENRVLGLAVTGGSAVVKRGVIRVLHSIWNSFPTR